MQPVRVYFKKQVRQTKHTAMDNKSCVRFAVICDPVDLDKILGAYDVGDGVFTSPHPKLVAMYLALPHDLQTTTIDCHIESMHGLSHQKHKHSVATQIES
jgi:hypothetical protein